MRIWRTPRMIGERLQGLHDSRELELAVRALRRLSRHALRSDGRSLDAQKRISTDLIGGFLRS
jgi:hypothetical protein